MFKRKKRIVIIITGLVLIAALISAYALSSLPSGNTAADAGGDDVIAVKVGSAQFGAKVSVDIKVKGQPDYPSASKYQILDNGTPISAVVDLAKATTIFPAKKPGDKVTLRLMTADKSKVADIDVSLQSE